MNKNIISVIVAAAIFSSPMTALAVEARTVASPFFYNFNQDGKLEEAGNMSESSSPYFWVNSGGRMVMERGLGKTVQGELSKKDKWFKAYSASNPLDTAGGLLPQNIFRLVTRNEWKNPAQEVSVRIEKVNLTDTPNRDGYSGILLMSRYLDGDNLYYAGMRMDGSAVIKKKMKGTYYTLAGGQVFGLASDYSKTLSPNLLPTEKWMRLKSEVADLPDGSVSVNLYLDRDNSGKWEKILSAVDNKEPIKQEGYVGIRTDYMDVWFDNYKITEASL